MFHTPQHCRWAHENEWNTYNPTDLPVSFWWLPVSECTKSSTVPGVRALLGFIVATISCTQGPAMLLSSRPALARAGCGDLEVAQPSPISAESPAFVSGPRGSSQITYTWGLRMQHQQTSHSGHQAQTLSVNDLVSGVTAL